MAAPTVYMEGAKVIVHVEFRVPDDDGPLTDATTVTFTARRRVAGVLETPTEYLVGTDAEATHESTGVYELAFEPAEGTWYVHVQGTGTAHAAAEVAFVIEHAEALA